MKRKRGYKKGKGKKSKDGKAEAEVVTVEDSAGGEEGKDADSNSGMEVDTPESHGTDQAEKRSPEVVHRKPDERKVQVVYGRVRVKLKSAKPAESATSALGVGIVNETDKSGQEQDKSIQEQVMSSQEKGKSSQQKEKSGQEKEKQKVGLRDKKEVTTVDLDENNDSSPDIMLSALGNLPKKSGGIKIKMPVMSSYDVVSKSPSLVEEGTPPPKKQVEKEESKYDKQELDTALVV